MPNNTTNTVTVTGNKKAVEQFKRDVIMDNKLLMATLVVLDDTFKDVGWYNWHMEHWGTKWETYNHKPSYISDTLLSFTFDTAWGAPLVYIEKLFTYIDGTYSSLSVEWVAINEDGSVPYRVLPYGVLSDTCGESFKLNCLKSKDSAVVPVLAVHGLRGVVDDGVVTPTPYGITQHVINMDADGNVTSGGNIIVDFNNDSSVHTLNDCKYTHTLLCTCEVNGGAYYIQVRDMMMVGIEGPFEY